MATARAIANGNWSATGTWNGGVLPGNGDTVYANGFNVTINQDILIGGANNPTVNAGSFVAGQWYEIDFVGTTSFPGAASNTTGTIFLANGAGTGTGTAKALATLTTAANTPAGAAAGGSFVMSSPFALTTDLRAGTTACLSVTGATALTLDGLRVIGGSNAPGCNYAGTTTCTLANSAFTGGTNAFAFNNASTGTVNVSASCTFTGGNQASALNNASTGTVNVSASCTFTGGSGNTAPALTNASTGTVNVSASCTFTASAFANAVSTTNTGADVRLSGDFLDHWSGWKAVNSPRFRLGTAPTLGQTRYALAGTTDSYFTMFGSDFGTFGNPIAADVRSGISYGGGNLTGTCAVPAAGSVALGVPIDATSGTAVLTPAAIRSELSVELGRIDAAISSRLAPSGTLATVTTLTNAPTSVTPSDIWSHATRTITGGTVTTLTNAPTVPTAAAIADEVRVELAAELANLDAPVSGATAPSASTVAAQVRTELTAELAKVQALNTERLANVATTAIVGNLIAQANS